MTAIRDKVSRHIRRRRENRSYVGLKINLYRDYEVAALAGALSDLGLATDSPVECVMVGDSYLMTHLGRDCTRLTPDEHEWGLAQMLGLLREVRGALECHFDEPNKPYLVGDFPDGSADCVPTALRNAERMTHAGADVLKLEMASEASFGVLEALAARGYRLMAHLGYMPQHGTNRRYGSTLSEAFQLFAAARRARDGGAMSLVLERVSREVHQALALHGSQHLPIYSIFSGTAPFGGQSLNVWDAVIRSRRGTRFFPPTAEFSSDRVAEVYIEPIIRQKLAELIGLTASGLFPLAPDSKLPAQDAAWLATIDPWQSGAGSADGAAILHADFGAADGAPQ